MKNVTFTEIKNACKDIADKIINEFNVIDEKTQENDDEFEEDDLDDDDEDEE